MQPKVKFLLQDVELNSNYNDTVFDVSQDAKVDVGGVCGGRGFCGKCQIVISGNTSPITHVEEEFLSPGQLKNRTRLACQVRAEGNVSVSSQYLSNLQVVTMGYEPKFHLDPAVKTREVDGKIAIVYTNDSEERILRFLDEKEGKSTKMSGLAIDIGTTKIVVYAMNLMNGNVLATYVEENPQIVFGADVMSRLARAISHGVEEQQRLIEDFINLAVSKLRRHGLSATDIFDIVVVGNSVMHHLFLGQNISNLSHSPYRVSLVEPRYIKASDLCITSADGGLIYAPPPVQGFVGSDALVGAYVLKLWMRKGVNVFIDLGTNSEIMVASDGHIFATSTPAGSAFEGMNIRHGMKSSPGAIESVAIEPDTLAPVVKTIGSSKPCGITGSGLVDVVSEMLRTGIIDYSGRFRLSDSSHIMRGPDGPEYVISRGTCNKNRISITQRDIRELQLAKAAVQAATRILMKKVGKNLVHISRVYVAGSFGLYINPVSGINIGLFPEIRPEKIETVGNTAGSGARILLKNLSARKEVEELAKKIGFVDLVREREFNQILINSTHLPSGFIGDYKGTVEKLSRVLGNPKLKLVN